MIKKMLSFTEPQVEFLEAHSSELGIGVPELVRRTVDHYRGAMPRAEAKEMLVNEQRTEEGVDVQVYVEQESGRLTPAKLYEKDGKGYIEGIDGQRYAIRVDNRFGRDVEIVMSVDGLDITTGKEANPKAEGHIVRAYSSYTFEGFRTSMEDVATFRFGGIEESYAKKMGKPRNVGVIGVAVYPEKPKPKRRHSPDIFYSMNVSKGVTKRSSVKKKAKGLGTTFGEARTSRVVEVEFDRESEDPWKVLTIRYDTLENLKELGIVTDESLHERESADPFPARGFCPPPPGR